MADLEIHWDFPSQHHLDRGPLGGSISIQAEEPLHLAFLRLTAWRQNRNDIGDVAEQCFGSIIREPDCKLEPGDKVEVTFELKLTAPPEKTPGQIPDPERRRDFQKTSSRILHYSSDYVLRLELLTLYGDSSWLSESPIVLLV